MVGPCKLLHCWGAHTDSYQSDSDMFSLLSAEVTDSMVQGPWEANSRSARKKFLAFYRT
jgi:hypothetical protein